MLQTSMKVIKKTSHKLPVFLLFEAGLLRLSGNILCSFRRTVLAGELSPLRLSLGKVPRGFPGLFCRECIYDVNPLSVEGNVAFKECPSKHLSIETEPRIGQTAFASI